MRIRQPHLSQNFLTKASLARRLVGLSSINSQDTALEIGSGSGIITRELLHITPRVITIEKDPKFTDRPLDFLTYPLPAFPYKIFSNIPFSITGEIVKKILFASNPPVDCYLIIQTEAAAKFMVHPHANTMLAILAYPYFNVQILHRLRPTDFRPLPKVATCFIRLQPHRLLSLSDQPDYRNFVVHRFIFDRQAKFISPQQFIYLFQKSHRHYPGAFATWRRQEQSLVKLHRTRTYKI